MENRRFVQTLKYAIALCLLALAGCYLPAVWTVYWDGVAHHDDQTAGIGVDPEGNIVVIGTTANYSNPSNSGDIVVVEYAPSGAMRWSRTFSHGGSGADFVFGTAIDSDGAVYAAGTGVSSTGALVKLDTSGVVAWSRSLPGTVFDVVAVHDKTCVTGNDATSCFTRSGALLFQHAHTGASGRSLAVDGAGRVYVAGYAQRAGSTDRFGRDLWVAAYDQTGTQIFERTDGTPDDQDELRAIAVDAAGNAFVTGYVSSTTGVFDFILVKLRPDGTELWRKTRDESAYYGERGDDVVTDTSGNVVVVSTSQGVNVPGLRITTKYDATGRALWTARASGLSGFNPDLHYHNATLDGAGRVYVTGTAWTTLYDASGTELAETRGSTVSDSFFAFGRSNDAYVAQSATRNGYLDLQLSKYAR